MNDFSRVKAALNLREVVTSQTQMAINAAGHLEACPFCGGHDCFSLPKGRDGYKCFQCDASGDVFTFLEKFHQTDRAGALKLGAELAHITLDEKPGRKPKLSEVDKIRLAAADYYHAHMKANGGKSYFYERRGHSEAVCEREKVGFTDGHLLDHLRGLGFADKDIIESGLIKEKEIEGEKRLLDFFGRGLVIFPHFGNGKVLHFTQKDPRDVPAAEKLKYQLPNDYRDKKWLFYGQDALDKFDEIILVEGENDRLQIMNAGVGGVMAMIGQISDEQIKALASRARGKHVYLWTDNDPAGEKYIRKISMGLPGVTVKVIAYGKPGDDPDSYLKNFDGDRRKEVRRLQIESLDYVAWEILQASKLATLEERLKHLRAPGGSEKHNVFRLIGQQPAIHQDIFREKLLALGFSEKAVGQQLDFSQDLLQQIHEYYALIDNPKDADPIQIGEICFRFFSHHGRAYYDAEGRVWLIYQGQTLEISNNPFFNALMMKLTRMIPEKAPGVQVWSALKHTALLHSRRIDRCRWIHTDTIKDTIFLNLNSPGNVILRISKERIEEVQNGMNDDHVLLAASGKIMPMTWLPDVDVQEGMLELKRLIFDNLAVKREQKYLILCWLISGFCPDMAPYQFLMKFAGYASSGKSTASKMLTGLVYGSEDLTDCSAAAAFSSAAKNPVVVIDNLENKDLNRNLQKFLLLAATRGAKEKRKGGSDTDTVDESPRALINITAIEPFTLPELISRTFELTFDRRVFGSDDFHESEVLEQIKKKRNLILSAIIRFIQTDILPNLEQRKEFMSLLNRQFKGHAKDRTNAYLALLMLILSRLLKHVPYWGPEDVSYGSETGEADIYRAWINEQNAASRENEIGSNETVRLLDGLVSEYAPLFQKVLPSRVPGYEVEAVVAEHPEYGLKMIKTKPETICSSCSQKQHECHCGGEMYLHSIVEFVATSNELVNAFDRLCKKTGRSTSYGSSSIFAARLMNDTATLRSSGWEIIVKPGIEPYFKKVHGTRFYKFRHTLAR
ncbi:MAG: toprim domain-containing protein [Deltaproteobacteria bacterium]|nr:MAG: toprim domain-containing protein [Deltaproteobacteria bacterium]